MANTNKRRWLSVANFAREIGCGPELVYQSIKDEEISVSKTPQGQMMIDANSEKSKFLSYHPRAIRRILENKRLLKENSDLDEDVANILEASVIPGKGKDNSAAGSLQSSKARREKALARKAELETEEKEGKLIQLDSMLRLWRTAAVEVRKSILAIPDRLAPVMAGERDAHRCHRLLTEELTYSLSTLSQNMRDLILREEELQKAEDEFNETDFSKQEGENGTE